MSIYERRRVKSGLSRREFKQIRAWMGRESRLGYVMDFFHDQFPVLFVVFIHYTTSAFKGKGKQGIRNSGRQAMNYTPIS